MKRIGIAGALVVLVALFAAGTAEAKIQNGNFEKGSFSDWKTKTSAPGNEWVVYTDKTRDSITNPVMGARGPGPAYRLPRTKGKYSSVISMSGEGHSVLYRSIKVPKSAKQMKLQAYWGNLASTWVFSGAFKPVTSGDQYWSIDLLDAKADPESAKPKDVLANFFKPDPEPGPPVMPRSYAGAQRGVPGGSTTPYTSSWEKFGVNVKKYRGEKVLLRLAEVDTRTFNYVGIDNVKFTK